MLKINNIKIREDLKDEEVLDFALNKNKIKKEDILEWNISKKSIDARKKDDIFYVYSIDIKVKDEKKYHFLDKIKDFNFPSIEKTRSFSHPPIIIGAGPSGLFTALTFIENGVKPIVIEQGQDVDERKKTIDTFFKTGKLNTLSNVQFGEGGAGTFSDGKLNSGINSPYCKKVLDGICSIYANDGLADEVRSMTMEDITNVLGITIDKEENKAYNKNGTEISGFQGFFGTDNQYPYKSNDYAPENYVIDEYSDGSYTRKTAGSVANILSATTGTVDQSAYMIMATDPNVVEPGSTIYNILFNGTTAEPYSRSYWLASPGVGVDSDFAYFSPGYVYDGYASAGGYDLFFSYGSRSAYSFAVRPVVSLKSEIKGSEIERDVASTSDIWDGKAPDLSGENLGGAEVGQVTTE